SSDVIDSTEFVPLGEVKREDYLQLQRKAMVEVQGAAQTLAAFRVFCLNTCETFASIGAIAEQGCLKYRTVEGHIHKLLEAGYITSRGRIRRRTTTYAIKPSWVNRTGGRLHAILPRWSARMLPTWAERATFALIVSLDSLVETIGDGDGCAYGRFAYSVATMAKHSGLSARAIDIAKAKLAARGLIIIDAAGFMQDTETGKVLSWADEIRLNEDFPVPVALLGPRTKRPTRYPTGNTIRSADYVRTPRKKCERPRANYV